MPNALEQVRVAERVRGPPARDERGADPVRDQAAVPQAPGPTIAGSVGAMAMSSVSARRQAEGFDFSGKSSPLRVASLGDIQMIQPLEKTRGFAVVPDQLKRVDDQSGIS